MGRREDFARTMRHEKPENLIIDFGGNPLSSMEGESENKLLEFLGSILILTRVRSAKYLPRRTHIFRRYRKRSTSTNGASAGGLPGCTGRA